MGVLDAHQVFAGHSAYDFLKAFEIICICGVTLSI